MSETAPSLSDQLAKLREPFPPATVGKLPRLSCRDCRDSSTKNCGNHSKRACDDCHQWISTAHIHLDYVGWATVVDRLLTVDPTWNWEPMALDEMGLPRYDRAGNLWIKLTILGITRLGVGSVESKKTDPEKQLVGDALRNAANKFGIALDLWSKSELESALLPDTHEATAPTTHPSPASQADSPTLPSPPPPTSLVASQRASGQKMPWDHLPPEMIARVDALDVDRQGKMVERIGSWGLIAGVELTPPKLKKIGAYLASLDGGSAATTAPVPETVPPEDDKTYWCTETEVDELITQYELLDEPASQTVDARMDTVSILVTFPMKRKDLDLVNLWISELLVPAS